MTRLCFLLLSLLFLSFQAPLAARPPVHPSTHRRHRIAKRREITSYYPKAEFKTYKYGLPRSAVLLSSKLQTIEDLALSFLSAELGLDTSEMQFQGGYENDMGTKFAYLVQSHEGVLFSNARANIVWQGNKVVAFGCSFVPHLNLSSSHPTLSVSDVLPVAEEALDGKHDGADPELRYVSLPDGSASLAYAFRVRNRAKGTYYEAFVSAHTKILSSIHNLVSHDVYNAVPIRNLSVVHGRQIIQNPQNDSTSPLGWSAGARTSGNNAMAQANNKETKETSPGLVFNYPVDLNSDPTSPDNVNAAVTNIFYVLNCAHDISYQYGFTERAFNYQKDNLGKGGESGDPVVAILHLEVGNVSTFTTNPDGESGELDMYLYGFSEPNRSPGFDSSLILHEVMHGITGRIAGGGKGTCMATEEAGGLDEGTSDMFANWVSQTSPETTDFVFSAYARANPKGARTYPYSVSSSVNPLKYSDFLNAPIYAEDDGIRSRHFLGEIWANILHGVYARLVEVFGYSPNALSNASGPDGNKVFLNILISGIAIGTCNPTFVSARDSIILADENMYHGLHVCVIWRAFASRGLGFNAQDYVDDFTVPAGC